MADAPRKKPGDDAPKRLNRAVPVSEALGRALDPVLKKRGFASRDLVENWASMVPAPYDRMSRPDKLAWPRGEKGAEGAVLHVSCHSGHALALAHEGARVAASINRYFGYVLVGQVRLSATPFTVQEAKAPAPPPVSDGARMRVAREVADVSDDGLREALRTLGHALTRRR